MFQDGSGVLWADEKMVTNKAEVIEMSYIMKGLMCLFFLESLGECLEDFKYDSDVMDDLHLRKMDVVCFGKM